MDMNKMIIKERTFVDTDGKTRSRWGYRGNNTISWIVIHYTGDRYAQGRAERTAKSMQRWKRTVSTHYLVGDDGIFQCVEDRHCAWHVGGFSAKNKCPACNGNSIGVDLVEHKMDPSKKSVDCTDWFFSGKVLHDGACLVAMLAEKYKIPQDHIVRHYDVTGKKCPRPFVGADINQITHIPHNMSWDVFLERVWMERMGRFQ